MTIENFPHWDFSKYLRVRRASKGLTQQGLADLAGIKRGKYKAKECGEKIDIELLNLIVTRCYGESLNVFFTKFDTYLLEAKRDKKKLASMMPNDH